MGDRTYCRLFLIGELQRAHVKPIAREIAAEEPADITAGLPCTLEEAFQQAHKDLPHTLPTFGFLDMNYGAMPAGLETALLESGLSWAWAWDTGDEYEPGVRFWNSAAPENERSEEFSTLQDEIALTLTQINSVDVHGKHAELETATRWGEWREAATFRVID